MIFIVSRFFLYVYISFWCLVLYSNSHEIHDYEWERDNICQEQETQYFIT